MVYICQCRKSLFKYTYCCFGTANALRTYCERIFYSNRSKKRCHIMVYEKPRLWKKFSKYPKYQLQKYEKIYTQNTCYLSNNVISAYISLCKIMRCIYSALKKFMQCICGAYAVHKKMLCKIYAVQCKKRKEKKRKEKYSIEKKSILYYTTYSIISFCRKKIFLIIFWKIFFGFLENQIKKQK